MKFFYPKHGITVEAENHNEAMKILKNKLTPKNETTKQSKKLSRKSK